MSNQFTVVLDTINKIIKEVNGATIVDTIIDGNIDDNKNEILNISIIYKDENNTDKKLEVKSTTIPKGE